MAITGLIAFLIKYSVYVNCAMGYRSAIKWLSPVLTTLDDIRDECKAKP